MCVCGGGGCVCVCKCVVGGCVCGWVCVCAVCDMLDMTVSGDALCSSQLPWAFAPLYGPSAAICCSISVVVVHVHACLSEDFVHTNIHEC